MKARDRLTIAPNGSSIDTIGPNGFRNSGWKTGENMRGQEKREREREGGGVGGRKGGVENDFYNSKFPKFCKFFHLFQ